MPTRVTPYLGGTGRDNRGKINVHPSLNRVSIGSDVLASANLQVHGNAYIGILEAGDTRFPTLNVHAPTGGATANIYATQSGNSARIDIGVGTNTFSLITSASGISPSAQITTNAPISNVYIDIDQLWFRNRGSAPRGLWNNTGLGVGTTAINTGNIMAIMGNVYLDGNLYVSGSTTLVNSVVTTEVGNAYTANAYILTKFSSNINPSNGFTFLNTNVAVYSGGVASQYWDRGGNTYLGSSFNSMVASNGFVGVNTRNPNAYLHVHGNAFASIRVESPDLFSSNATISAKSYAPDHVSSNAVIAAKSFAPDHVSSNAVIAAKSFAPDHVSSNAVIAAKSFAPDHVSSNAVIAAKSFAPDFIASNAVIAAKSYAPDHISSNSATAIYGSFSNAIVLSNLAVGTNSLANFVNLVETNSGLGGVYYRNLSTAPSAYGGIILGNTGDARDAQILLTSVNNANLAGVRSLSFISNVGAFGFYRNYTSPQPILVAGTTGTVSVGGTPTAANLAIYGNVYASTSVEVGAGGAYKIKGNAVLDVSSNYTELYSGETGTPKVYLGASGIDPSNYYDNDIHNFRGAGGAGGTRLQVQSGGLYHLGNNFINSASNIPVGRFNGGSGATANTFWRGDGTWAIYPAVTGTSPWIEASGTLYLVNTSSRIGLGVTSASYVLHAEETNTGKGALYHRNMSSGAGAYAGLIIGNNSDSQEAQILLTSSGNSNLAGARSLNFISNIGGFGFFRGYTSPAATMLLGDTGDVNITAGLLAGSTTKSRLAQISAWDSSASLKTLAILENENGGAGTVAAIGFATAVSGAGETRVAKAAIGLERTTAQGVGDLVFYNRSNADTTAVSGANEVMRMVAGGAIKLQTYFTRNNGRVVPWYNVVTEYGATGDGTTDDTTAIQNAYTAVAAVGGTLYFPPGTYKLTAAIGVTTTKKVVFRGDGPGLSILKWTNSAGGIEFTTSTMSAPPEFRDLSLRTSYSGGGVAITVQSPTGFPGGNFKYGYAGPVFDNLDISGDPETAYWTGGIYCIDSWYPTVSQTYFKGSINDGGNTSGDFYATYGYKFANCQAACISTSWALWADKGVITTGTALSEGFNITECEFVGVGTGIDMTSWSSGATNGISFHDLHINSYIYGINLNRICNLNISGSYFIKSASSTSNYVGIQMTNGRTNRIIGNYFEDGYNTSTGTYYAVLLATMNACVVSGNVIDYRVSSGAGIIIGTDSAWNTITGNIGNNSGNTITTVQIESDAGSNNTTHANRSVSGTAVNNLAVNPQNIL